MCTIVQTPHSEVYMCFKKERKGLLLSISVIIGTVVLLNACATSMLPGEVFSTLPSLTKSQLILEINAEEAVKNNRCEYLVKGRNYVAPIGFLVTDDLKNAATGIDEWVKLDGGNAYVLKDYKWVTVYDGSTQLHVEFDTMLWK